MLTGKIKWFSAVKNYGFIILNGAKKDDKNVFLHGDEFNGNAASLKSEMWVTVSEVIETAYGPRALGVALCGPKRARSEVEMTA